jgi:hypothetical protein
MEAVSYPIALPRVDEVPASVALTAVARKLAATYSDVVAEGVPEHLASIAERVGREEDRSHDESLNATPGVTDNPLLAILVALGIGYGLAWMIHGSGSREDKRVPDCPKSR